MEQQRGKKDNGGYLFRNAKKSSDKQPDYRGKVNVNGKEMLISGWIRQQDGEEMISLSLTDPATLPPKPGAPGSAPAASGSSGASASNASNAGGSFARQSAPAAAATPSPKDEGYSDLEDLDGLFNGLED